MPPANEQARQRAENLSSSRRSILIGRLFLFPAQLESPRQRHRFCAFYTVLAVNPILLYLSQAAS
jgi:hypothetical protein